MGDCLERDSAANESHTMPDSFEAAAALCRAAGSIVSLTGAGISVDCGIPDFRSPGGLWTQFSPDEYATLDVFLANPHKAWVFYRALGAKLFGKQPGPAHLALARLEDAGLLPGIVTQNIDGLHTLAGSRKVVEVHGDYRQLQCLQCGRLQTATTDLLETSDLPTCPECRFPLKPNVVLFGEWVRQLEKVDLLLADCDVLLVIGTSAQVYPVAGAPHEVLKRGGTLMEFNVERTVLTPKTRFFFEGPAAMTVPRLVESILGSG